MWTVDRGTCGCLGAKRTDFFVLRRNASPTRSTFSSLVLIGRSTSFLCNTELLVMKLVKHPWILGLDTGSFLNFVWKFRKTWVSDLFSKNHATNCDFFFLHALLQLDGLNRINNL
ncbi:hypothetical protein NPIL_80561 [Nephila pilipes]|uniref:Uncharacterized protein n=1 Tax=Nephila pilipes TaxID=299642 RepID=A0A8X6URH2_NEPPI|nr:hypothetical protein NPIL_80561 [Nephila pilipes]